MGFLMYVKQMGEGGITPKSKIFKNDAKKLKLTPKVEHNKSFPKWKEKFAPITIFDDVSSFLEKI